MIQFHRATLWVGAVVVALATLAAAALSGLDVAWNRSLFQLLVIAVAPVACLLRDRAVTSWVPPLIDMVEGISLFAITGLCGGIASYVVAAHTRGYVDGDLAAWDHAFGFDWLAWYRVTAPWTAFHLASRVAYGRPSFWPAARGSACSPAPAPSSPRRRSRWR